VALGTLQSLGDCFMMMMDGVAIVGFGHVFS
jgi:hypothetical protein